MRKIIKKIIIIIKIIYIFAVIVSLCFFGLYATYTLELNTYYEAHGLSQIQSDEIKELIGLSDFDELTINSYSHKLVYGDDAIAHYVFDLTIPNNEYDAFIEYINTEMNGISLHIKPCIKICKDDFDTLKSSHRMQIDYIGQEGSEGDIQIYVWSGEHDIHYAGKGQQLLVQFAVLLLSYVITYFIIHIIFHKR